MEPSTDVEDSGRAEEEEEEHRCQAEQYDDNTQPHEHSRSPEGRVQYRGEVLELPLADDVLPALHE